MKPDFFAIETSSRAATWLDFYNLSDARGKNVWERLIEKKQCLKIICERSEQLPRI